MGDVRDWFVCLLKISFRELILVLLEIARDHGAQEVIGVDIDSELVSRAWRHRRHTWSLQEPSTSGNPNQGDNNYFPECFTSLFGPVAIPAQKVSIHTHIFPSDLIVIQRSFPSNVSFYASDWANQGCATDQAGYNVVVA